MMELETIQPKRSQVELAPSEEKLIESLKELTMEQIIQSVQTDRAKVWALNLENIRKLKYVEENKLWKKREVWKSAALAEQNEKLSFKDFLSFHFGYRYEDYRYKVRVLKTVGYEACRLLGPKVIAGLSNLPAPTQRKVALGLMKRAKSQGVVIDYEDFIRERDRYALPAQSARLDKFSSERSPSDGQAKLVIQVQSLIRENAELKEKIRKVEEDNSKLRENVRLLRRQLEELHK